MAAVAGADVLGAAMSGKPAVRDPGPMARLRDIQADAEAQDEIFRLLSEGKSLSQIASAWKLPKHRFSDWMLTEHAETLAKARASITDEFICELVPLLREVTPETAGAVKTRVDGFLKLASKWDRGRYGEHVKVEKAASMEDATGLLTAATDLLREIRKPEKPEPRVIDAQEATPI